MNSSKQKLSRSHMQILRMKQIASSYFHAKKMIDCRERALSDSHSSSGENIYTRFVARVNKVFSNLDDMDRTIINNDFYYEDYQYWYTKYFSASTYYRLRNKAIKNFLSLYNRECRKAWNVHSYSYLYLYSHAH